MKGLATRPAISIVATAGFDSPFAGPVALGAATGVLLFSGFSLANTAVANWGLGCSNSW